jgi:glycerate kinase
VNHVLIAPDKFKGSLTALQVADAVGRGLAANRPDVPSILLPMADGGDGTLAAAVAAGFRPIPVRVRGPVGDPVDTAYAALGGVAVVEMADACGLARLPGGRPAPMTASSFGLGQVIAAAAEYGARRIVVGVGGSASTDGGAGMLSALGARLLDADGRDLPPGGGALQGLDRVDLAGLHAGLAQTEIVLATDVDNPLLGDAGAACVYAAQKGASPEEVRQLEDALRRWSTVLAGAADSGSANSDQFAGLPGAGAAGGVGFAALAVLHAQARPGIDLMLELTGFHEHLAGSRLVVTGEGSLDRQSLRGKAPVGVAAAARKAGIPVVAVAGRNLLTPGELAGAGLCAAYALLDIEPDPARCMAVAAELLERLAMRVANDWLDGHPSS